MHSNSGEKASTTSAAAKEQHAAKEVTNNETKRRGRMFMLLQIGTAVVLLNILVLVLVFVLRDDSAPPPSPASATPDSPAPSASNSSSSEASQSGGDELTKGDNESTKIRQLLPGDTIAALEDPASPQSFAFEFLRSDAALSSYQDWRIQQRFALATFYYATDGADWRLSWFLELADTAFFDQDECSWFGLACTSLSNQTETIRLNRNNLQGSIPPEFYWLSSLRTVSLSENNMIQGSISSHIGMLKDLEEISFAQNVSQFAQWNCTPFFRFNIAHNYWCASTYQQRILDASTTQ
jgi:hypothetical protein